MGGDFLGALTSALEYPGVLTYMGWACILVAIPVKIGFSKHIKKAIEGYNRQLQKDSVSIIKSMAFISGRDGIGLRVIF